MWWQRPHLWASNKSLLSLGWYPRSASPPTESSTHRGREAAPYPAPGAQRREKFFTFARQTSTCSSANLSSSVPRFALRFESCFREEVRNLQREPASFRKLRPLPAFSAEPWPPLFEFENYKLVALLAGRAGHATFAGEEAVRVMVRRRGWLTARIPGPRRGNGSVAVSTFPGGFVTTLRILSGTGLRSDGGA